ncbi:MAG: hypothetical protein ACFCUO_11135 [Rhodospirillales bacterium]
MIDRLTSAAAAFLVFVVVAACATDPVQPLPELTFAHQPPLRLNVASLDVVSGYRAPMRPPNVEHKMPLAPEAAMRRWAEDRLRAMGHAESARYTVITAAVTEEALPKTPGFVGAFKNEPSERYTATVEAQLEIFDGSGRRAQLATARATRSRTVIEGAKPEERERVWFELVEALMKDFDEAMERAIRQYATPWLL